GVMYKALGATWYSDQTVIKHTTGTSTTATVNGAGQTGPNLTIDALAGTLVVGDIITIAAVNASPADAAVITPYLPASTTYRNNFRYSPQAITMATGDLPLPANKVTARHKYETSRCVRLPIT